MMTLMNEIAHQWWQWMGPMLWQASLLIVVISVLDMLLRKWAWPQVRYALWLLVLIKLVVPPTWSLRTSIVSQVQPGIEQRVRFIAPRTTLFENKPIDLSAQRKVQETSVSAQSETASQQPTEPVLTQTTATGTIRPSWQTIAMAVWLVGIITFFALLLGRMLQLRHWHQLQKKREIPQWFHELLVDTAQHLGLQRLPAIVFSNKAVTPAVYGMFRPVMLLPANYFDDLTEEEAAHVLLHELAHLKRGDLWLHGICLLLQIVYWFNPLILWVRRQMKHVREICCDLTVANVLREKTVSYRRTLLNTAKELLTENVEPGLGLLGVFEEPFRLVTRLRWLEKKTWEYRRLMLVTAVTAGLVVTACFLPMAGVRNTTKTQLATVDKMSAGRGNQISKSSAMESAAENDSVQKQPATGPQATRQGEKHGDMEIHLEQTGPLTAAVLPKVGSYDGAMESLIEAYRMIKAQKIKVTGDPFARFFSDPDKVPPSRRYYEVGFPIKPGTTVKPPLEIIRVAPSQVVATTIREAGDTEILWTKFFEECEKQGFVPGFPPAVEIYRMDMEKENSWQWTEMQVTGYRFAEGYPGLDIKVFDSKAFNAVVLPMYGSYAQMPVAVERVKKYVRSKNMNPEGKLFGQFYSDPSETIPSEYRWLVGCAIDKTVEVEEPFEIHDFASMQVASATFSGEHWCEYPWVPFIVQAVLMGRIPIGAGMEFYHGREDDHPQVELRIPVMYMPNVAESASKMTGGTSEQAKEAGEQFGKEMAEWGRNFADQMVRQTTGKSLAEVEMDDIRRTIEENNHQLDQAMVNRDIETIVKYYSDDVIVKPDMAPEIRGLDTVRERLQKDIFSLLDIKSLNSTSLDLWKCGDLVYDIRRFAGSVAAKQMSHPFAQNGKSFTLWQQQPDGSFKIIYSIFNSDNNPFEN
jgi:beta-lactamase regulating signal transducer with metallopeptidase domain/ketosteroid isomerase-like protein/DNA gyrase inhibitor GyrI